MVIFAKDTYVARFYKIIDETGTELSDAEVVQKNGNIKWLSTYYIFRRIKQIILEIIT